MSKLQEQLGMPNNHENTDLPDESSQMIQTNDITNVSTNRPLNSSSSVSKVANDEVSKPNLQQLQTVEQLKQRLARMKVIFFEENNLHIFNFFFSCL